MKRIALALAVLSAVASAQTQTTKRIQVPSLAVTSTNNLPFAQNKIHYQQWYSGAEFARTIKDPVRVIGLEFLGRVRTGVIFDIEVTMAHASTSLSGVFQNNFISNKVVVLKRTRLTPSGATLGIMFTQDWKWDGRSNVVVDIKIFGNALGKPFNYAATSTVSKASNTKRQYAIGNPNATVATSSGVTAHYGLATRFLYQEGGTYDYGIGCPGGMNIVPEATANQVPLPGLSSYAQILNKAGSGYPAIFVLGASRTQWGPATLPFPMRFLGGPNCGLVVSPDVFAFTKTVGGGPGKGTVTLPTPIPGIGALAGVKVYSQWLVFDKASINGNLSATAGLMHVIGS